MADQTRRLPLRADWGPRIKETLEFRTEMIGARKGKEQRRALRAVPRRTVEFSGWGRADRLAEDLGRLAAYQKTSLVVPDPLNFYSLSAAASAASTTLALSGFAPAGGFGLAFGLSFGLSPSKLQPGVIAVLHSTEACELVDVLSVASGSVTLAAGLLRDWPAGSRLYVGIQTIPNAQVPLTTPLASLAIIGLEFEEAPGTEVGSFGLVVPQTYNGRELVTIRPNWANPLKFETLEEQERTDVGQGLVATFHPAEYSSRSFRGEYVGRTAAGVAALKGWFLRARGRRDEFYMPSWLNELPIADTLVSGEATLRVLGDYHTDAFNGSGTHKHLYLRLRDGAEILREVSSVAQTTVSGAAAGEFTLDATWPYGIEPADVAYCAWLLVWRFASDKMTLDWETDTVARTSLNFTALPDL